MLRKRLADAGLVFSGTSPDNRLVEVVELPAAGPDGQAGHPFFVASQYHPEFKSRPERPEPMFREFVAAALQRATGAGADAGAAGEAGEPQAAGRSAPR
jgi:CTP synthase